MKMVKSLLLGSAAGFMAVAGAQAADLPVKAKAVEYVKVCSLYGVGFYYIPGTDTCIKIGGYVRYDGYHNAAGFAYPTQGAGGNMNRFYNTWAQQARFRMTGDVRTQTEYGTLRAYFAFGVNFLNTANELGTSAANTTLAMERAFIQFAGFTIGRADTFFAFYNGAAYGLVPTAFDGSSGPGGLNVFAYTWQFGNGLSASVSAEDQSNFGAPVIDLNQTTSGVGFQDDRQGQRMPNLVANLRVDQAWGSAQIMGALHDVGGRYYNGGLGCPAGFSNSTGCANPGNEIGWAVGAGLTLKMPWDAKDTLSGVIAYAEGASRYIAALQGNNFLHKQGIAMGQYTDGVFANPGQIAGYNGGIELTQVWGGSIAFEHYWTPSLRTSWVAGYMNVEYSDTAKALLAANGCALANTFSGLSAMTNCNPDWSAYRLSSRTMWNPVANLDIGVEVAYSKVNTAYAGSANLTATTNGVAASRYAIEDQDVWSAAIRVQRSFWP
ncbi:MAG: porin [Pseudomonadota bacterium]